MGLVNDHNRILKVGFLQKSIDLLGTQTRVANKLKPLADQILDLIRNVLLSLFVQNIKVVGLSGNRRLVDTMRINKGLRQPQVASRFTIRITIHRLSPPVVGTAINRVSALHDFATLVVLQVGGHKNVDLLLAQQALGHSNGRAGLTRTQAVVQQKSTLRRFNGQVITNQRLIGKQLAGCFAFFCGAVQFAVFEESTGHIVRKGFAVGQNESHCFSRGI